MIAALAAKLLGATGAAIFKLIFPLIEAEVEKFFRRRHQERLRDHRREIAKITREIHGDINKKTAADIARRLGVVLDRM